MNRPGQRKRGLATLLALTLGGAGLTVFAAPTAHAADDDVAKVPIRSFSSMVVDSEHERIYISDDTRSLNTESSVLVYTFQGQRVGTLTSSYGAVGGMALSADSSKLFVSEMGRIAAYDTETYAKTVHTATTYYGECGRQVAYAGGKVWHTETPTASQCDQYRSYLYGSALGAPHATGWEGTGKLYFATAPQAPGTLVMGQTLSTAGTDPYLTAFDSSGDTLVRGPQRRFADGEGAGGLDLKDLALSPDGSRVAVADAAYGTRLLDAADLSDAPTPYRALPEGAKASAVAFSGDGEYVARGATAAGSVPDLLIQKADPEEGGSAFEFAFEGDLDGARVAPRGLGWSKDGSRLFALTTNSTGTSYWLHVIQPPAAQYDSRFTGALSTTPAAPVVGEPLGIRGRLELDGAAPAEPVKVSAVRRDADGDRKLAAVEVDTDGTFTVLDVPSLVGEATYTLSFLGDVTHRPAEDVTLQVAVAKAPTAIALAAPAEVTKNQSLEITGTLTGQGRALPSGITLSVRRTDKKGTGTLTSAAVAADGTFRINDLPSVRGEVVYTVAYAGDGLHSASTASATVRVRPAA
ncbi:Ig-like domain-containing protein [Streptomyces sp. NPDC102473]|uniref:Ig-like domain-containing protein n=1 Tax=Streptomyces sp. NPDC102473 TaxID=3366180 RepID=UPI003827B45E